MVRIRSLASILLMEAALAAIVALAIATLGFALGFGVGRRHERYRFMESLLESPGAAYHALRRSRPTESDLYAPTPSRAFPALDQHAVTVVQRQDGTAGKRPE